jgi:hypothetical protein
LVGNANKTQAVLCLPLQTTCEAKQGAEEGFPHKEGVHMSAAASTMMAVAATTISSTDGVFLLMA